MDQRSDRPSAEGASYAAAGVDIDAQEHTLSRIRQAVRSTFTPQVRSDVGSFGALVAVDLTRYRQPYIVSSVDSVGTKILVAVAAGRHDTVGLDIVNHCVNDIAVMGADPLCFLDYYATARLEPDVATAVIGGIAEGCRQNGCALVGGELAELPGMYVGGVYDLVGCVIGLVEPSAVPDITRVADGDVLLGLPSSGLHTNGYSLARRVLLEQAGLALTDMPAPLDQPLVEVLLAPHRSYLAALRALRQKGIAKVAAHITGGGLPDNLPRVLPDGLGAVVRRGSWVEPPVFALIQQLGQVSDAEMFRAFNMGLGLVVVVAPDEVAAAEAALAPLGLTPATVGRVQAGRHEVLIAGDG